MAEILEQDEELTLAEGEEIGELGELGATPSEPEEPAVEEPQVEEVEAHIPEKFRGKSLEDVIQSYEEVEKALGRKNNEVGELRKLTDDFLKQSLQLNETDTAPAASSKKIEVDDLLDDPNKAIEAALSNNPRLQKLEQQLVEAKREEAKRGFDAKHPDGMELVQTPEFQNWVAASPTRYKLFMDANNNYDYDLADELLATYKELQGVRVEEAKGKQQAKRDKALKDAATEKGSTGQSPKKIYRRSDLMKMMMNNREAYDDPNFQAELSRAYQENRVR